MNEQTVRRYDRQRYNEVRHDVRVGILHKMNYAYKVAADIYGKTVYITEAEVRALQVLAKRKAEESDEAFAEFTENVIVYAGPRKRSSRKMIFQKDGSFENDFECGFFDVNTQLAAMLL